MGKIGLVTVLYKSDDVLEDFFKSISIQTYTDHILYLVDNSVNDATDKLILQLANKYPSLQYEHIKSPGNIGVAAGNNVGIHKSLAAGCLYVLLLNNDIEIKQDYVFTQMVKLCADKNISMVVPKIYYYDTKKLWMAGGYMDTWRALGVHYGYDKDDAPQYNIAKEITYAPTCFMLIAKEVFDKVGFMEEKYFAYYDDTDFVIRATNLGCKLYYDPSINLLHKVSSSVGTNSEFYVYYSNRNKLFFIRRNLTGIKRYFAILYTLFSRVAFYLKYDKGRRKKLLQGLKDGFKL